MTPNNCPECGGIIYPRVYPGGTPRRFCSRRCARLGQHRRYHVRTAVKHRAEARQWERDNPEYTAYLKQRRAAKYRGIAWHLTFDEWLFWWGSAIAQRGKNATNLCMCRYGDVGPYALHNIYKDTIAGNVSAARQKEIEAERAE